MSDQVGIRIDEDLQALVASVLESAGFVTAVTADPAGCILAENEFAILVVVAVPTMADLLASEPMVEELLRSRVDASDVGPKLWDAYLVLLTQERLSEDGEGLRPLYGINYDTRGFRRIARTGVKATLSEVRAALSPFVCLLYTSPSPRD